MYSESFFFFKFVCQSISHSYVIWLCLTYKFMRRHVSLRVYTISKAISMESSLVILCYADAIQRKHFIKIMHTLPNCIHCDSAIFLFFFVRSAHVSTCFACFAFEAFPLKSGENKMQFYLTKREFADDLNVTKVNFSESNVNSISMFADG